MKRLHDNKIDEKFLLNRDVRLNADFYSRDDVVLIAKELLGKILVTYFEKKLTAARIAETEAYKGIIDKASHAYKGRRTARTEIMYRQGGAAYVYLCYGIHHLFNVVTNAQETPHAILIRAAEPVYGIDTMLSRTKKLKPDHTLTKGPGNVSRALGISTKHTGINLLGNEMFIIDDGTRPGKKNIIVSPRIGVDYAEEDALLPYRFYIKDNPFVSGKKK
ncbi:MAG TPA: DNA-3-methyladenine glycosylase [Chitinophagaceae bacterium]